MSENAANGAVPLKS